MIGDLAFLITIGIAFTAIGAVAWRIVIGRYPRCDEWPGIALPLGLGLGGTVVGISASCVSFEVGLGVIAIAATLSIFRILRDVPIRMPKLAANSIAIKPALTIATLVLLIDVPGLFAPVIDGDALCYHLEVAKRMVQYDSVRFDPDLHETAYPLVVESLQAIALKCRGPIATRAVSFWFGIGLAFGSACLAGSIVQGPARHWSTVLVLISPVVHCGMVSPLNDVALAALCTSSLAAWLATQTDVTAAWRRLAIAGAFCGMACGVKFPGIVWLAVFTGYLIVMIIRFGDAAGKNPIAHRTWVKSMMIFASFVAISGGFWYVRAAALTGNPVHPYFRNTFGGNGLDEVLEDARKPLWAHALNIAAAPAAMALAPGRFDSFSHQSGPLFLALIPLGFMRRPSRRWMSFVTLGWLLMALCLTQRQSPRFFVATFALWSAAAAAVLAQLQVRLPASFRPARGMTAGLTTGCLCLLMGLALSFDMARARVGAMALAGLISPHGWLISNEPTAKLRDWVSAHLPPEARLVGQDHRAFYWPRPFTMEKAHRRRTGLMEKATTPEMTIDRLRSAGFTHLVMAEPNPLDAVEFDTDLSDRLAPWLARQKPLLDMTLPEIDGYQRRYRIFELDAADIAPVAQNRDSRNEMAVVESRTEPRTGSRP